MPNLKDVNIINNSPIKTGPGTGNDIGFVNASPAAPYGPIAVVMDPANGSPANSPTGKPWIRINGHWKETGLTGWVELAHTAPVVQEPEEPPDEPVGDVSEFLINWKARTVTLKPK